MKKEMLLNTNEFCVMFNSTDVIWVYSKDVKYHKSIGYKVYKFASTEEEADKLCEKACYLPL